MERESKRRAESIGASISGLLTWNHPSSSFADSTRSYSRIPMPFIYPAGYELRKLDKLALALKIARHSPCTICDDCIGLHPARGTVVALDTSLESSLGDLTQYGSDDEDSSSQYLRTCACGHDTKQHGADEERIGKDEYARRGRVAIRLDELLMVRLVAA